MTCETGKHSSTELSFIILDPEHWFSIAVTSLEGQKNFGIKQRKFVQPPRLPSQNQEQNTKLALSHIVNDFIKRKSSSKECSGQSGGEKKLKGNNLDHSPELSKLVGVEMHMHMLCEMNSACSQHLPVLPSILPLPTKAFINPNSFPTLIQNTKYKYTFALIFCFY